MDSGVSGFEIRGPWRKVVEHGRRVTDALHHLLARREHPFDEAFQEWEDWRPRIADSLEGEMSRKTSRQASVDEGRGERAGKEPGQDMRTAGRTLRRSMSRDDGNGGGDEPDTVRRSLGYAARALDSAGRKLLRTVERAVYEKVMTRVSPYYFDNELVSANLRRERNGDDEETFVFEVNINDDDLKERVGERLDEADEDDRERTTAQVRSSR